MQNHILPFANLALGDAFSAKLQDRKMRWVLEKWREKMAYPFTVYATIDDEGSASLLNLRELLLLMGDAGIMDNDGPCTEHKVKTFFALVNMADELFEAAGSKQVPANPVFAPKPALNFTSPVWIAPKPNCSKRSPQGTSNLILPT